MVIDGNSLRVMRRIVDDVSVDGSPGLNISTGLPLRYDLDAEGVPMVRGGQYLDLAAAAAGCAEVAAKA